MNKLKKLSLLAVLAIPTLFSCNNNRTVNIKVLILPKFEVGNLTGDDIGEAQLLYEEYFLNKGNVKTYTFKSGQKIHVNTSTNVALGITDMGKANVTSYLSSFLNDSRFNSDNTYFIGVGCAGSSMGYSLLGDVAIISETIDFDFGHYCDPRELEDQETEIPYFPDEEYKNKQYKLLNKNLIDKCYEITKDIKLETTKKSVEILKKTFPEEEWINRDPKVLIGASVTSDTYWKGTHMHNLVNKVSEDYFKVTYPYAMTEMEDAAISNILHAYNKLDKFIDIRASVNLDVFYAGSTPESLWKDKDPKDPANQMDIFVPAMRNMTKVSKTIIDAILNNNNII